MAVKFSDLNELTVPANADLFVLRDTDLGTTKHITWENIQLNILSDTALSDRGQNIVNVLNDFDTGLNTPNGLSATNLWYNNNYRTGDYFLEWGNLLNKPLLLDTLNTSDTFNLSQFDNNTGFVRWQANDGNPRLIYQNTVAGTNPRVITTDDLNEGSTNLYYTNARADARITTRFPTELSRYTATFDQGNTADSLSGVDAVFLEPGGTVTQDQANVIRISDTTLAKNFNVGQKLRIYGASELDSSTIENGERQISSATLTAPGLGTTGTTATFSYMIAEYNDITGDIAAAIGPFDQVVEIEAGESDDHTLSTFVGNKFSIDKFISLSLDQTPTAGTSVAIYRKLPLQTQYHLVAVLGYKDISENNGWNDYYNFDFLPWHDDGGTVTLPSDPGESDQSRSKVTNQYTKAVHFPLTAPTTPRRGWVDILIGAKTVTSTHFDLRLGDVGEYVWINSDRACQVSHNDTSNIQDAINANANVGRKSIDLNAKTYIISSIEVPDNFGLNGTPFITKLKKLPWSGGGAVPSTTMISSTSAQNAENISIVGVDIDGDASNQFLVADATANGSGTANYAVNLKRGAVAPLFDKVRITNVVGGGIYATESKEFRFLNGEIRNSGNTDRFDYSPIIADNGQNTIITSNVIKNFTDQIDVSVTDRGVVTNNVIENTGSGLFIYGSKFILSSPNILIGPADEFLPTPDILNSEYDSVSIYTKDGYLNGDANVASPVYVYQENGIAYDLTQTQGQDDNGNGGISTVSYDTFLIAKDATSGEEYFWEFPTKTNGQQVAKPALNNVGGLLLTEGKFQFNILASDITRLHQEGGDLTVKYLRTSTALGANTNPEHVGVAYTANYEHEVRAGTIPASSVSDAVFSGVRDPSSTSGTGLNLVYDTGVIRDAVNGDEVSGDDYALKVYNMKYLSVGSRVKMAPQHTGFVATGNTSSGIGTVTYVSNTFADGDDTYNYVSVNFPGTTSFDIGDGGYINIIDKFVLAQGRIL
jgi:hypothetical protein